MQAFYEAEVAYLSNLCTALARFRRRVPGEHLVTCLVSAEVDGRPLSDAEILSTMLLLVVAGDDTTKQATTLSLLALHDNPVERDWLCEDFERRVDGALEEFIRYASPVIVFARTARVGTPAPRCFDHRRRQGRVVLLFREPGCNRVPLPGDL